MNDMASNKVRPVRVGVVGARGHVGAELVRLLAKSPDLELSWMTSSTHPGEHVVLHIPEAPPGLVFSAPDPHSRLATAVDVVVLALPNGSSDEWVVAVDAMCPGVVVVDLGSDHRFDDSFVYGLPSRNRDAIKRAKRIANPGCYATAMAIALDPLVSCMSDGAHAFGVSGYSGAGTTASPRNDRERLRDNMLPYSLVDHVHEREVMRALGQRVRLLPHVAPFFRGITVTLAGVANRNVSRVALCEQIRERWENEPLVTVTDDAPLVRDVVWRHEVFVGGVEVASDRRSFSLVATVDNLLGGAATTAVRNLNLATGRPELAGLTA